MPRRPCRVFLCLFALTVGAASGHALPRYAVTDLGTLPGGAHSGAYGINDKGQIVGWSDGGTDTDPDPDPDLIHNHAVLWDKGRILDLGLMRSFPFCAAKAVNNKGQVVGGVDVHYLSGGGGMMSRDSFLWQHGRMTIYSNTQPPSHLDDLNAINNKSEMVGIGFPNDASARHPLLWVNGKGTDLGLLPGGKEGAATGINDEGDIVGWVMGNDADKINGDYRAFLCRDGKMTNLGEYPIGTGRESNHFSQAFAINNRDQIVGRTGGIATLWQDGFTHFLYPPSDSEVQRHGSSTAYAINDRGQIVGSEGGEYSNAYDIPGFVSHVRAFLYQHGVFSDLNDLLPAGSGWVLRTARGINEQGQIVGVGEHEGKDHAYLLTPLKMP